MTTQAFFEKKLLDIYQDISRHCPPGYGDNVMPALRLHEQAEGPDGKYHYTKALQALLRHEDPDVQDWAVSVCVGFVVFADVLRRER